MDGRYQVYGFVPPEHEHNPDFKSRAQQHSRETPQVIYATDDRWEAKRLVNIEGGFIKDERWYVVVGALDTKDGGILGYVPEEEPADGAA